MPSIDERIVSMAFENSVFESRVSTTMATLSKLDSAIKNMGSTTGFDKIESQANRVTLQGPMSALDKLKARLGRAGDGAENLGEIDRAGNKVTLEGPSRALDKIQSKMGQLSAGTTFTDIEKASSRVSLEGVTRAVDNVTAKFSVLQGAASVALGNIGSQAVMRGGAFSKSFAFGPIMDGLEEYKTNLGSIQTILANTEGQQVSGLGNVNKYLGQLNTYSDKTIYNFGQMAKNIGTFTAAGVDLPKSVESIKGIANLAALSGSNSQQASTAMYQLSQAIASGKVGLQDWNSVVNAGMGGAVFQKALLRTADNMGAIEKGAFKIDKATGKATVNGESFRESIMAKPGQESWLTSDVLVKTLGQFTGDLKDADLAAQGFSASQIKAIQAQAKTAQAAATEVKTLPQVFDIARETIGSGWAKTFQNIFGNFNESKKTFTEMSNFINGFINQTSNARNKMLAEWKKLGGRTELIEGIKAAFDALLSVLDPIKKAFRDIFPAQTGKSLFELTQRFRDLMEGLKLGPEAADKLRRIFAGLFAVLHIGWTIVKDVTGVIAKLLGVVGKSSGGFTSFIAAIGDFLVSLDDTISKGNLVSGVFDGIMAALGGVISLVKGVGKSIGAIFTGADKASGLSDAMKGVADAGGPLVDVAHALSGAWKTVVHIFDRVKEILQPAFDAIGDQASRLADTLGNAFKSGNFDKTMAVLQTGFLGGILLILKRFKTSLNITLSAGIVDKINGMLGAITGNLKAMQQNLQAKTLFAIAASLGVLVGGIYLLSTIDGKKLTSSMTAMAVGIGELVGALGLLGNLSKGLGKTGILLMPFIAASMIELAVAATILAAAVKIFSTMSWEELAKGLAGLAGGLTAIGLGMKLLGPGTLVQGPALILIAVALNILASAVKQFGDIPWDETVKGIVAIGGALAAIGLGMKLLGPSVLVTGPGLVAVAIGMNLLAGAVASFGSLDLETLAKGIGAMAVSLVAIGLGMAAMPPTIALTGAGLIVVAAGMTALSAAIGILGSMKVGTLVKGILAMGGALVVLAVGLDAMTGTAVGAVALLAAATALTILGPAIGFLGVMKWKTILSGLGALVAILATLAVAGTLVSGPITALSFALGALGVAMALVTSSIFIFAKSLAILGATGPKGIAVMMTALTAFAALLPTIVINFIKGLVGIADSIAKVAPRVLEAIGKMLGTVIAFVVEQAPKLAVAVGALIGMFLTVINNNAGPIINAGLNLMVNFLKGVASHIGPMVTQAGTIIIKFLGALAAKLPQIVAAGANVIVKFLEGLAAKLPQVLASAAKVVVKFLEGITAQIPRVVGSAGKLIASWLTAVANQVPKILKAGTDIIVKFINGIGDALPRVIKAGTRTAMKFMNGIAEAGPDLVDAGFKAIIKFLHGIANAIRENSHALWEAGFDIVDAIVDGMLEGFKVLAHKIWDAANHLALGIPGVVKKALDIFSPSRVMADLGAFVALGLAKGIGDNASAPIEAMGNTVNGMISQLSKISGANAPSEITKKLGKEIGGGFAKGLVGSDTEIRDAFTGLRSTLNDDIKTTRDQIKTDKDQLEAELAKKKDDQSPKLIADLRTAIAQNTTDLNTMSAARRFLNTGLKQERQELLGLSSSYGKISAKLEKAKEALAAIVKERDDAAKSFTDKYSVTPTITEDTSLADYNKQLADRIAAVQKYHATLQALRAAGLDDTTYRQLLDQGTQGQAFADQLLAAGPDAIASIKVLDTDLQTAAGTLGDAAAHSLYDAGVKSAQGLVDGLKSEKNTLKKLMSDLADAMVKALKKKLKIESPSKAFAEIGDFVTKGLARGLEDSSAATTAATKLGEDVLTAMSSAIGDNIDVDPVIAPVLDLTQVESEASKLGGLLPEPTLTASTSLGQATQISADQAALMEAALVASEAAKTVPSVTLEQNNYSPDPLSNIEIYRQTNNQMARLKSLLGVA